MISWLLREMEKDPSRVFMEGELSARSRKDLRRVKKERLLKFVRLEAGADYVPCPFRCSLPCPGMRLDPPPRGGKGIAALACCDEDPEADTVALTRGDLSAYCLDLDALAERFRRANSLDGRPSRLARRLFYLGETISGGFTLAVVLGFFPDAAAALSALPALPSLISGRPDRCLVAAPSLEIADQSDRRRLEQLEIYLAGLDEEDIFRIDLAPALKKTAPKPFGVILTPEEEKDFARHQFKSRLPIEITGAVERRAANVLRVGGAKVTLGDAPFALFLRLAAELFQGGDGCVFKGDGTIGGGLVAEGFFQAGSIDQEIHRLRDPFIPALRDLPATSFVEAYRPKHLRLSTHPRYLTLDKNKLLNHPDPAIAELAKKLQPPDGK